MIKKLTSSHYAILSLADGTTAKGEILAQFHKQSPKGGYIRYIVLQLSEAPLFGVFEVTAIIGREVHVKALTEKNVPLNSFYRALVKTNNKRLQKTYVEYVDVPVNLSTLAAISDGGKGKPNVSAAKASKVGARKGK